eukprot:Skav220451  [mRNA]  locus=scaffold254:179528:179791:- [translate_table: standard]
MYQVRAAVEVASRLKSMGLDWVMESDVLSAAAAAAQLLEAEAAVAVGTGTTKQSWFRITTVLIDHGKSWFKQQDLVQNHGRKMRKRG